MKINTLELAVGVLIPKVCYPILEAVTSVTMICFALMWIVFLTYALGQWCSIPFRWDLAAVLFGGIIVICALMHLVLLFAALGA